MITKIALSSHAGVLLGDRHVAHQHEHGSLPSISPAWMPLWIMITTLLVRPRPPA
jgi:hypothetical protein